MSDISPPSEQLTKPWHVLIAEDAPDLQALLQFVLESLGISITTAGNGQEALALASDKHFDAILMDMQMPIMDGYEATKNLRRNGCKVPIIALTARDSAEDRAACIAAGCDDYRSKPLAPAELMPLLKRWIVTE